jgi:hypothetical protein
MIDIHKYYVYTRKVFASGCQYSLGDIVSRSCKSALAQTVL